MPTPSFATSWATIVLILLGVDFRIGSSFIAPNPQGFRSSNFHLHIATIDPSSVVDGSPSYYPFPLLRDNNESSPTDVSRLPDQIHAPLSPPSDHMQPHHQTYMNKKKRRKPGLQAWKRRLNTKEDSHSLHKISNAAFVLSSTAILGGMMFGSDGFQTIPAWLAPFDAIFLLSTTVQASRGIAMVLEHRKRDPELGLTQVQMGLTSILMALYSNWESPFCLPGMDEHWQPIFSALILFIAYIDFQSVFVNSDEIYARLAEVGVDREEMSILEIISFNLQFTSGSIVNCIFMANYAVQDMDRGGWLEYIQAGYGLPFATGATISYVYFSTILAGTILSYQSFVATLVNKKLVSANKGANIIAISGFVEIVIFVQLLFANSLYGQ